MLRSVQHHQGFPPARFSPQPPGRGQFEGAEKAWVGRQERRRAVLSQAGILMQSVKTRGGAKLVGWSGHPVRRFGSQVPWLTVSMPYHSDQAPGGQIIARFSGQRILEEAERYLARLGRVGQQKPALLTRHRPYVAR